MLDVNTKELIIFSNKLEKIGKTKLPYAVRQTLNSVAFDMKKDTLIESSGQKFVNRSPNFFKALSRVQMAKGLDINSMESIVGFVEKGLKGKNNYAVKDLEQQEKGGKIGGKTFIPTKQARGGSLNNLVLPQNRLSKIRKKFKDASKMQGANKKEKFVKAVLKAKIGGYVLGEKMLYRINSIHSNISDRSTGYDATPLYSVKKGRSVKVDKTKFVETAAKEAAKKMESHFINHAKNIIFK